MTRPIDPARFERLVEEHHASVWLSARRVLRSGGTAEDVTQEVFLRVLDGRLDVDDADDERRVLCWWAVRLALNTKRGAERRRAREDAHAMDAERRNTRENDSDDAAQLWNEVDALPDDLRVPLVLRFAEGYGFAEIGRAVGVAESTAFERVKQGLARLRRALEVAGLGVLAAELEARLAVAATPTGGAPVGLSERIMQLQSATATTATSWSAASLGIAAVLVVAGGGALAAGVLAPSSGDAPAHADASAVRLDRNGGDAHSTTDVGSVEPEGSVARERAAPALSNEGDDDPTLDRATGRVRGRVLDESGSPLADCEVSLASTERSGKFARYTAGGRTDAAGRFDVAVEVSGEGGGLYRAHAITPGRGVARSGATRVTAGATTDIGDLRATPSEDSAAGSFRLSVVVVDALGAPIDDVRVDLWSAVRLPLPPGFPSHEWFNRGDRLERRDARAGSDPAGRVHFEGDRVGAKVLRVVPSSDRFAPRVVELDVADGSSDEIVVALADARSISGRVRLVDDRFTPEHARTVQMHVIEPVKGEWRFVEIQEDGAFELRGLADRTYRLKVSHDPGPTDQTRLSRGWLEAPAGATDVDVALKAEADPRDVGVHRAELHGRFVDATTGEPMTLSWWSLELVRADVPDGVDVERDWLPNHAFPRPVQRAAFGTVPDDSDEFHRTGLSAGRWIVMCDHPDRAAFAHGPIELAEREIRSDLVVELHPGATLSGAVKGPDGRPVEDAWVFLTGVGPHSDAAVASADAQYREIDGRGTYYANGSGARAKGATYTLDRLPPGVAFRIVALHPKYEPALGRVVTVEAGARLGDVDLTFTRSR